MPLSTVRTVGYSTASGDWTPSAPRTFKAACPHCSKGIDIRRDDTFPRSTLFCSTCVSHFRVEEALVDVAAGAETAKPVITPTKRGFRITRPVCVVCGEPPFGDEYCCGHSQEVPAPPTITVGESLPLTNPMIGPVWKDAGKHTTGEPYTPPARPLTFGSVQSEAKAHGMTVTRKDGEYRVAFPHDEKSAYYTNDLQDALGTMRMMVQHRKRNTPTADQSFTVEQIGQAIYTANISALDAMKFWKALGLEDAETKRFREQLEKEEETL